MRNEIFELVEQFKDKPHHQVEVDFSFTPFLNYLEGEIKKIDSVKKHFFEFVLVKFKKNPHLRDVIPLSDLKYFNEELELIYNLLQPPLKKESTNLWGLCIPFNPVILFGTEALYELIKKGAETMGACPDGFTPDEAMAKEKMEFIYMVIFQKLYNQEFLERMDLSHSIFLLEGELPKYYRIHIDTRFIDVIPKGELPPVKMNSWANEVRKNEYSWTSGLKDLPFSMFGFKGFGVLTVEDVTEDQSVENIKNLTLNRNGHAEGGYGESIVQSLKSLLGSSKIEFGILPNLRVNGRLVFSGEDSSVMVDTAGRKGEAAFMNFAQKFLDDPKVLVFGEEDLPESYAYIEPYFKNAGIESYALLPIYHSSRIAGVLELYSVEKGELTRDRLSRLRQVLPIIAQLLQNAIDEFNHSINTIIADKFTALQPAVQWKFNEVAWYYQQAEVSGTNNPVVEKIRFKNVYPLYGAIDIRNSTIERNNALAKDLSFQLEMVLNLLEKAKDETGLLLIDEIIFKCNKWKRALGGVFTDQDSLRLNDFLEQQTLPLLEHLKRDYPQLRDDVAIYLKTINEVDGQAYQYRRSLEKSIQSINKAINNSLVSFNDSLQKIFPAYFEKFRTDGLEYDIYIGQSIVPSRTFDPVFLKNVRLLQLRSMAEIAVLTESLRPKMDLELQTTQLIFIRSLPVDIAFRPDERKFDVEGSYNMRYQIVKKRIDKVNLKNKPERLTQPGKIALVYINKQEADEYTEYIGYLQSLGLLNDDLEYLELEDLQGVTGLKALRVGVCYNWPLEEYETVNRKEIYEQSTN